MEILKRNLDREKTKGQFKKVIWVYDLWSWLTERKAAEYALEFAEIKDKTTILEVACGTGIVFAEIVKQNPNGKNIGIDLSPDMLQVAKARLDAMEGGNFELKEGDLLKMDFGADTFDVVINNFMVDLMPADSFDLIAAEFHRITKPNGKVIVSTFSFGKKKINKLWFWIAKYFPGLLTGCRPVQFGKYLVNAGFEIEKTVQVSQNTFPSEVMRARKVVKNMAF
ncbi:methyltransferase domain-containing protein [Aequorivita todarodis]|uniref:class I SAM-dependent methyltransferase n=1 Tax=Aequorivita todarodis TaxID=2036821 RepID=UPI002350F267|nr:class I SAM-dependent methyltransferase [Aequorivita todarodis]MDC8000771.1 methyltransferase domain-containing protein [Aequorivita todarodis]